MIVSVRLAIHVLLALGLSGALLGLASAQERPATPQGAAPHRLLVTVMTRNDRGKVFCGLWHGPEGYPMQRRFAVGQARDRTIVNGRGHCAFEGMLEPGEEYAVAAFHDENANNDLDRGIFGIPTEGTGASNDARGFMGPPQWQHARFVYPDVREHQITIHIGY